MRHNDRYELLCQTAQGYVQRCPGCGALRIRFRNVLLDLAPEDVAPLRETIADEEETVLYVGESRAGIVLSPRDITQLHRLLDKAELLLGLRDRPGQASADAAVLFPLPFSTRRRTHARS